MDGQVLGGRAVAFSRLAVAGEAFLDVQLLADADGLLGGGDGVLLSGGAGRRLPETITSCATYFPPSRSAVIPAKKPRPE